MRKWSDEELDKYVNVLITHLAREKYTLKYNLCVKEAWAEEFYWMIWGKALEMGYITNEILEL